MRQPHVDDVVRLNQDIPELELTRGQTGVVRSTWFAPTVAYEVEFDFSDALHAKRGELGLAAAYVLGSVVLSIAGLFAGLALVRHLT